MTYLDVVTGFLGAGKTTFLTRYTRWLEKQNMRYCVIENEFGRAGVDGALLEKQGVRVKEISGGCVCCTLKVTLHDLIRDLSAQVDRIILEPSGLFCGDDLMDILGSPDCAAVPGIWVGIVDPLALPLMSGEDLAVLQSELMQAGSIAVSKAQLCEPAELKSLPARLTALLPAPAPKLWLAPWDDLDEDEWFPALQAAGTMPRLHERRVFDHASMFQSAAFSPKHSYTEGEIRPLLHALLSAECGEVLRAKGTLRADGGLWQINLTPGCEDFSFAAASAAPMLNIIGRNLNRKHIRSILEEIQ